MGVTKKSGLMTGRFEPCPHFTAIFAVMIFDNCIWKSDEKLEDFDENCHVIYRGLCTSLFYRYFCPKYRNRKFRKMYTDILQNDIIIISKKIKQRIESVLLDTKKKTIFIQ